AVDAIHYQDRPCHTLPDLWNGLHSTYNATSDCPIAANVLEGSPEFADCSWTAFSSLELKEAIQLCSNNSAPGPDHVTWQHLKYLTALDGCCDVFLFNANACVSLGHWPSLFKESVSVIIPKPGKPHYSTPKMFRPIVLLNTLGKLFEKMIARRLQFDA